MRWHYAGTTRGWTRSARPSLARIRSSAGDSDGRYHSDPSVMCRWTRNSLRTLLRIHSRHFVTVEAVLVLLTKRATALETILLPDRRGRLGADGVIERRPRRQVQRQ